MNSRWKHFPKDMAALLFQPLGCLTVAVTIGYVFRVVSAIRHPTVSGWLLTFHVATAVSIVGVILLLLAKLPQYRSGVFWRIGFRHLSPFHQRLYRLAFLLIVPSCLALLILIPLASRVRELIAPLP